MLNFYPYFSGFRIIGPPGFSKLIQNHNHEVNELQTFILKNLKYHILQLLECFMQYTEVLAVTTSRELNLSAI